MYVRVIIAYEFTPLMLTSFYILRKVFCLSCWDLPTHSPHHPPSAVLVPLGNSWWLGVHQGGFVMFIPLDIPCKSNWILNNFFRRKLNNFSKKEENKLGQVLRTVGKSMISGYFGGDILNFGSKLREKFNFE